MAAARLPTAVPIALTLVAGLLASACGPIVHERGVSPEQRRLDQLEVGESDRATVAERLGAPTVRATFAPGTWYYVYQRVEQFAFLPHERTEQRVVVFRFDEQGRLADTAERSLEDGRQIAHSPAKTPTQGSEVSVLRQILGNVGRGVPQQ